MGDPQVPAPVEEPCNELIREGGPPNWFDRLLKWFREWPERRRLAEEKRLALKATYDQSWVLQKCLTEDRAADPVDTPPTQPESTIKERALDFAASVLSTALSDHGHVISVDENLEVLVLVLDHLNQHPGTYFTTGHIATNLSTTSAKVQEALNTLLKCKLVIRDNQHPTNILWTRPT